MSFRDLQALVRADESESAQRSALKRRAITLLARREHSRAELTRKLLTPPPVRRRRRAGGRAEGPGDYEGSPVPDESFDRPFGARGGAASFDGAEGGSPAPRAPSPELVESVLDELEGMKLLSDRRMAESLVRNGAERFGRARLSQDLQRKGLDATSFRKASHQPEGKGPAISLPDGAGVCTGHRVCRRAPHRRCA